MTSQTINRLAVLRMALQVTRKAAKGDEISIREAIVVYLACALFPGHEDMLLSELKAYHDKKGH